MTSALLLAAAAALPLSPLDAIAPAFARIDPVPGAWAEYLVRSGDGGEARIRVTVLRAAGEGRYWLELAAVNGGGVAAAARLLARGRALAPAEIERMEVMLAGQQPIAIPLERLSRPPLAAGERVKDARRRGPARVRVPAGTFVTERLSLGGAQVWCAAGVPLWGIVKARTRTRSAELLAFGLSGGHSVFPRERAQGNGSERAKE